ncbi:MAG: DeoR/GlpR family DNA-binding transcription regulator [Actinomycetaceae bacterium]|nr:DeoR/GlpR family DNA-binding transcription regulator [Actinomycetaceae bacterium]MDU0970119.1 DeoR/GlpR family DNA-binding transcription regulator [Actinomycetaceae bacterium]
MYAEERRAAIMRHLHTRGSVAVNDLAQEFDVTTETVRRDLDALAEDPRLRRVHGGAILAGSADDEPSVPQRAVMHVREKAAIAQAALELIPADQPSAIVLDSGTTTQCLCDLLGARPGLNVYTNSLLLASSAAHDPALTVHMTAGTVRGITQAVVGAETVQALADLHPDFAFVGCNGMSPTHGYTTPDSTEAAVKRQMVAAAATTVIVADSFKIDEVRAHTFARPDDIDVLVTDEGARGMADDLARRVIYAPLTAGAN